MNDESPLNLKILESEESPELVRGAMRRFRWRVVLSTALVVLAVAALTTWGVATYVESRKTAERSRSLPEAQLAVMDYGQRGICETPTYEVADLEVGLLNVGRLPQGGWALLVVVHSGGGTELADGTGRFMSVVAVAPGAVPYQVGAQAGNSWGEVYMLVPDSAGRRFDVVIAGTHLERLGSFTVDTRPLVCSS